MKKINFIDLNRQYQTLKTQIDKAIFETVEASNFIQGPEVKKLEAILTDYTSTKALTVANGTDALFISLRALGVGPGDEVITPSFTWVSTVETIKLTGAKPVYCDISEETFNIDESLLENLINKNTKVIMPVSLFGRCADLNKINQIAKENNLITLEDAAQSFGAKSSDQMSCSVADISTTSFFPAKPLGCYGDGGAIFTDDEELANKMKSIRIHGSGYDKYENIRLGINGRLDTMQAAILLEKLSIFDYELKLRNKVADYYSNYISSGLIKPYTPKDYYSSWAQYSLLSQSESERTKIMSTLSNANIPSMIYYKLPLHLQTVFKKLGYEKGDFPISEKTARQIFSIPMHPYLDNEKQDRIIEVLNKY